MKLTEQNGLRILTPDNGQWLYKDDNGTRIFSDLVYLAKNDSPDNWRECTTAEKEAYEAEHNTEQDQEETE